MSGVGLRCALISLAAFAGPACAAPEPAADESAEVACGGRPLPVSPWSGREAAIASQGALPPTCLQALVRECADAAQENFLDGGTAAACSVRYEALLRHGFGGDFEALLAWWRQQR